MGETPRIAMHAARGFINREEAAEGGYLTVERVSTFARKFGISRSPPCNLQHSKHEAVSVI